MRFPHWPSPQRGLLQVFLSFLCVLDPLSAQELEKGSSEKASWTGALDGVRNAREIALMENADGKEIRSHVLVRSGALSRATPQSIEKLKSYGLQRVIDLRTEHEIAEQGANAGPFGKRPLIVNLPVKVEVIPTDIRHLYQALWKENQPAIRGVLNLLADQQNHPLLIHGASGTDRTGIIIAVILELAGVSREAIFSDFTRNDGTRKIETGPLEGIMAIWDAHPQGLEGWLIENAEIDPGVIKAIRHYLFDATPLAEPKEEIEAAEMLSKAETDAANAKYTRAVSGYKKIVKKHPETRAGRIAKRRLNPNALLGWTVLIDHGNPDNRVDIAIMGDGYLLKKQSGFDRSASRLPKDFENHPVFSEYYKYHNFIRVNLASEEDGVDMGDRKYSTALNARASDYSQGQVSADHKLVRQYLEQLPYHDNIAIVFVRAGSAGTGGGGVAVIGGGPSNTVFHEWGHAFGGLMDEYSSDVGYTGSVRSGVNVSNSPDPGKVSWKHWIEAGVPQIGVFEGAAGRAKGAWKSNASGCAMASGRDFCRVCREALVLRIYNRVDPIDLAQPISHPLRKLHPYDEDPPPPLTGPGPHRFSVKVLQPKSQVLETQWWLLKEAEVPAAPKPSGGFRFGDRRDRGLLNAIRKEPQFVTKGNAAGLHEFELDASDLEPGRYRVLVRIEDTTLLPGEDWPWVLVDRYGVLQSERGWWLEVK